MLAIGSRRPSRLPCVFAIAVSALLAGSALAAPPAARASSSDFLRETISLQHFGWPASGSPFYFVVDARLPDDSGSDRCFHDTVHFTYTDGTTVIPPDFGFTAVPGFGGQDLCGALEPSDEGWHEFEMVPRKAGDQTLTVTDISDSSVASWSMGLTVVPGPAVSATISGLAASTVSGAATPFRVTLYDAYGNVATGYGGTMSFTSSDAGATLPAAYTFNAGDAGTHLFTAAFATSGSRNLEAYDTANSIATFGYTTVTQAPHFNVEVGDQSAGQFTSCYVTAVNASGTVATGYTGTVQFTSSDPAAVLPSDASNVPGQITFTAGMSGNYDCYSFDLKFFTAGAQTVTVTDESNSTITGSGSVNVFGGDTTSISIEDFPTSFVAGSPLTIHVKAFDQWGNWGSDGVLDFSSTDPQAVLPAGFAFHTTNYGVREFSVTLKTQGPQSLTLSGSESGSVLTATAYATVFHGDWDHLSVSPSNATIDAGTNQSYTAIGVDAYGNTWGATADTTFSVGGGGSCTGASCTSTVAGAHTVTAKDGNQTGTATLNIRPVSATHLAVTTVTSWGAGVAHTVTVNALDQYGNTATGYRGTIHLTSTDPAAVLPANYTFTATDAGHHAFSGGGTLKTAGTRTITATDTVHSSIAGTQTGITVTPAAATHFKVVSVTSWGAGVAHTVTVNALDAFGNVATGYRGTLHFTSTDPAATLPANYTFTATDAGHHAFSGGATLKTAGTRTITATDTVHASITGAQTGIAVTAGSATHLSVVTVNPYGVGAIHTVTVNALDAFGNVATGYRGTIHFTSSDSKAMLPADYAFTATDNGTHAFSAGLNLKTAGSQWVRATDTVTPSITGSETVTVS